MALYFLKNLFYNNYRKMKERKVMFYDKVQSKELADSGKRDG